MDPSFKSIQSGFQNYVAIIKEHPDWDDDRPIDILQHQGVENGLAEQLVHFVPSAFGRAIVRSAGIQLSDYCYVRESKASPGKRGRKLPLASIPAFVWANSKIDEFRATESIETLMAIAGRSAELKSVNAASESGISLKDLAGSAIGPSIVTMRHTPIQDLSTAKSKSL